ncbi:MAG: alpha/beta hydrolase [Chloroflexi bacterium]|nr:alpha/beta hydrolase [Chloroflexota bacterium]MDA1002650.1 alpha/beta hydrolase [Chloroflexota bacterium]
MAATVTEVRANGLTFRVRRTGPTTPGVEPVVLLHGFPSTSYMWLPLLERLGDEGFACVAPDQRGYSPGARPFGAEQYDYRELVADVIAITDASGFGRFHLVAHDHGAGVGWTAVGLHPDRIASYSALSVPHIDAFRDAIAHDPDQRERSIYIERFEKASAEQDMLRRLLERWQEAGPEVAAEYVPIFSEPGALTAALNWYRASLRYDGSDPGLAVGPVDVPTLLIWGNRDPAIGRTANEETPQYMRGPYRFVELDAGHRLLEEQPEAVISEVLAHLCAHPVG